jgi:hypothetical protein
MNAKCTLAQFGFVASINWAESKLLSACMPQEIKLISCGKMEAMRLW